MDVVSPSTVGFVARDDFLHARIAVGHALLQVFDSQLVRANAIERGDDALQDMVNALELAGFLHRDQIARLGDDAQPGMIAARVGTDVANFAFGIIVADAAELNAGFDRRQRLGQRPRFFFRQAHDIKCQTLGAFGADAGQLFKFTDQTRQRLGIINSHRCEGSPSKTVRPRHPCRRA